MNEGTEWFVDAEGCSPARLRDIQLLRDVCNEIIADLKLIVIGEPQWHQFPPPGGVTGLYLLSESHLACHTYPEDGIATFNLYCCRPRPKWDWSDRLWEALDATNVRVRFALRGESADRGQHQLTAANISTEGGER
ncbi:MAG TPA: S-adenosylmethionine decarboxylase [Blastocatellia bacterium]|nr:S-adenosylmethionine decarboxylase [Blastocatellia bacterium]